jgi:hypothetical protein
MCCPSPLEVTLLGELKSSCLDTLLSWTELRGLITKLLLLWVLLLLLLLTLLELKTE